LAKCFPQQQQKDFHAFSHGASFQNEHFWLALSSLEETASAWQVMEF